MLLGASIRPQRPKAFAHVSAIEFRIQGLGFRIQGLGFRIRGLGFRVRGLGFSKTLKTLQALSPWVASQFSHQLFSERKTPISSPFAPACNVSLSGEAFPIAPAHEGSCTERLSASVVAL